MSTAATGKRARNTRRMSWIAAPVGEVTTPMRRGTGGSARLRSAANKPSAASLAFEFLEFTLERAFAGFLEVFHQ